MAVAIRADGHRRAVDAARQGLEPGAHPTLSRWVKARHYSDEEFFRADGAGEPWIERRRRGTRPPGARCSGTPSPVSIAWGEAIRDSFSDLRFTDANRVPFPFARVMRERFNLAPW